MLLRYSRRSAIALLLISCIILVGCTKDKLRVIADNSDRLADYSLTTLTVTQKLLADGVIKQPAVDKVVSFITPVNKLNRVINDSVKDIIKNGIATPDSVAALIGKLNLIDTSLDAFNRDFIALETNDKLKAVLTSFYAAAKGIVSTIRVTYMEIIAVKGGS